MNTFRRASTLLVLGLMAAGCQQSAEPGTPAARPAGAAAPAETGQAATPDASPRARAREIRASGREGVWQSAPDDACTGGEGSRVAWNIPDDGVEQVAVYLVGTNGDERIFARGGSAGEKDAGRWLRSGMAFVVRDAEGDRELARTTLAAPDCR